MNINNTLKALNRLDWALAVGTLAAGLYLRSPWVLAAGVLGILAAWYRPAERIKARLEKKFLRKKTQPSDTAKTQKEDAFYAEMLGTPQAQEVLASAGQGDYRASVPLGSLHLSRNPYSVVRYHHVNLLSKDTARDWA